MNLSNLKGWTSLAGGGGSTATAAPGFMLGLG